MSSIYERRPDLVDGINGKLVIQYASYLNKVLILPLSGKVLQRSFIVVYAILGMSGIETHVR